jgi:hypothetical protein
MGTGRSQRHLREIQGIDSSGQGPGATPPVEPPPTPVTATGTAVMGVVATNNPVASVTITLGGVGYTVAPTVTFSAGDGAVPVTATGTAVLTGDAVTSVTIVVAGAYADGTVPTVTFSAPA